MTTAQFGRLPLWLAPLLIASMLLSPLMGSPDHSTNRLTEEEPRTDYSSPTGLEAACGSLTFEDMFNYSFATFDVDINDDWQSAWVQATAYVNDTLSDQVRTDLDWLFGDQSLPGGDNGWLSTDERAGTETVGRDCVEETHTRLGFRAGPVHRGGVGVDWRNSSWSNDDGNMVLEEWNLLPVNHPNWRNCQHLGASPDCREIPVEPLQGRNCDDTTADSPSLDECKLVIWLNGTIKWQSMSDTDQFTIAMNMTNMTHAQLAFTFPPKTGTHPDTGAATPLRVAMFEECDGRMVDEDPNNDGSSPSIGGCQNNGGLSHSTEMIDDAGEQRLRLTVDATYDFADWPTGQDMFIDMTTETPPPNDPPVWTNEAPAEGDIIPIVRGQGQPFMPWSALTSWLNDEAGVANLDVTCSGPITWGVATAANGDRTVNVPSTSDQATVSCEALDDIQQSSGMRNWTVAVPYEVSSANSTLSNPHIITVSPESGMGAMSVTVRLLQDGVEVGTATQQVDGSATSFSIATNAATPGDVSVETMVSGVGILSSSLAHDVTLAKESSPPSITISETTWDGTSWSARGQFSDPDGEEVTFTIKIGEASGGTIIVTGNTWQSQSIDFELEDEGTHTVSITACDTSERCTTITADVDNTHLFSKSQIDPPPPIQEETESSIPAPGLLFVLLGVIGALLYVSRRA